MTSSIYGIGTAALANAQAGVLTAGHNIANANTPGFSRQTVEQKTNDAFFSGAGFVGTGASISTIKRNYDNFLIDQVRQSNSDAASQSTYLGQMKQIDDLLGDPSAGLSPALGGFFQAVQAVSAQPADISARQALLSSAQALASRFRSFDSQLSSLRDAANRNIQTSVGRINSMTQQIANLNDRISRLAGVSATSQQPNDLLDQRDALIADLNKEIGANVVHASDGTYSVFLSSGQPVVLGNNASILKTVADTEIASDMQVSVSMGIGGTGQLRLRADDLSGGKLGGYLAFRREGLTDAQNALGRIAMAVGASVNEQHRLGQDLNGQLGGNLFSIGSPLYFANANNSGTAVISVGVVDYSALEASDYRLAYDGTNYTVTRLSDNTVDTFGGLPQTVDGVSFDVTSGSMAAGDRFLIQPVRSGARDLDVVLRDLRSIAAATPMRTSAALANTGTGSVSAGTVNAPPPPNANLQNPVTITFTSPTTFDASGTGTGDPVGVAFSPGAGISYNGWTIQINGQPAAGDSFAVSANTNGSGDNRNVQILAALQTANRVGGTTFNGAYGQLVSQVGSKTSELQITSDAQASLAAVAEKAQNAVSGVNLDEEASNLIRYQQAYQAAGKMIGVASTLFDTILNLRS